MSDRPKDNERKKEVRLVGIETGETETVHLKWPNVELKVGDVVERRSAEGKGNEPSEIRKSSESPYNLFSNAELAKELLQAVSESRDGSANSLRSPRSWNQLTSTRNSPVRGEVWSGTRSKPPTACLPPAQGTHP